jgi:hypothetical protein
VRSEAIWYILWLALFVISAGNTLAYHPIFSGSFGFLFSVLLVMIAATQFLQGITFLNRKEIVLAPVLLCLFGAEQARQLISAIGRPTVYRGFDFSAYYLAAKLVSRTPSQNLYDLPLYADGRMNLNTAAPLSSAWQTAAAHYHVPFAAPFIYPPLFAVVMKPLAYVSFGSAYIAWEILAVLLLGVGVALSLNLGATPISSKLTLMLGVGLFSYFPVGDGLFMGQIDCLIFFLLAAGVWLLKRNHILLSAFGFAAATLFKLTPVLAVPLFLFHRRWKWLAAYAAWMCSLSILSLYRAGWAMHRQFWTTVLPSISCGAPVCQNSSLVAYVQELFLRQVPNWGAPPLTIPAHACAVSRLVAFIVYSLFLARFYLRRRDGQLVRDLVIMVLLELVVSPISWWHHNTIALLPFLYLWCTMPRQGDRILLALFLVVGTNIVGYSLLLVENHAAQLILAAIVPSLTIMLVYFKLAPAVLEKTIANPSS